MSDLSTYHIYALSESAALIDLGNTINEPINNKVLSMQEWMARHQFQGFKDMVAAYRSLTILYDPYVVKTHSKGATAFDFVKQRLEEAWSMAGENFQLSPDIISIPVCYDPELGHDLKLVAAAKNMSVDELISLHCSKDYRVYMLGFLPGFAYMGRVPEQLVMPRRSVPRENVEAGSVGIAGWQTGIYPLGSPGGWHIIGRTPLKMFDAQRDQPAMLKAGDTVRFYPVARQAFDSWRYNNNYAPYHH